MFDKLGMYLEYPLVLCFVVLFTLAGCGDNASSGRTGNQPAGVNDVLEAGMADEDSKKDGAGRRLHLLHIEECKDCMICL